MDSVFPQFKQEDELILISLPYRVGLYVSFADTSGGFEAQEAEMQTLSGILREFAEDFCKSEFSQKVLMESLRARPVWPSWSGSIERVPEQAAHIVKIMETQSDSRALRDFKDVMVEIALSVAMAFREGGNDADAPRLSVFGEFLAKLFGGGQSTLGHGNISKSERAALGRLCKAMNYDLKSRS